MNAVHRALCGLVAAAGLAGAAAAQAPLPPPASLAQMTFACGYCHGPSGEGNEARSAPRLAGLDPAYIQHALRQFQTKDRGAHPGDSYGPQMAVIAALLQPGEIAAIAAHYGQSSPPATAPTFAADLERGRQLYEPCSACHGDNAAGDPESGAPALAQQADWYLVNSLRAFRAGGRRYAETDAIGQAMLEAIRDLPDDAALRDVAAYIVSLDD